MVVHTGTNLPVAALTNDTYARSVQYLQKGRAPLADTYRSITRFIKAARMVQACRATTTEEMTAYAFEILEAVSAPRTQWRIVYDNRNMQIHYLTQANTNMRRIDILEFDFSPATSVQILDVNAGPSGNVSSLFAEYTYEANRDLIGRSFGRTGFLSGTPAERLDAIARFPERFVCE
jgi:penicillin V acylase-like amidase (Ntn superfamily)